MGTTPKQETHPEEKKHFHSFEPGKEHGITSPLSGTSQGYGERGVLGRETPSTMDTIKRGLTGDYQKERGPSGTVPPEILEQELRQSNFKIGSTLAVIGSTLTLLGAVLGITGGALSLANLLSPRRKY